MEATENLSDFSFGQRGTATSFRPGFRGTFLVVSGLAIRPGTADA
jgi:hypothetical protein